MPLSSPIESEKLESADVRTAREIGFIYDYAAHEIIDPQGDMLQKIISTTNGKIEFIVARNNQTSHMHLGLLYPGQDAATFAHALSKRLSGVVCFPHVLASKKAYNLKKVPLRSPSIQSPILHGIEICGGGEIGNDQNGNRSYSGILESTFGLLHLSQKHMKIVRDLVFKKLGREKKI